VQINEDTKISLRAEDKMVHEARGYQAKVTESIISAALGYLVHSPDKLPFPISSLH